MADDLPQLRDIHLPVEPSWWPPAPGWWILFALSILVLVLLARRGSGRLRRVRRDRRVIAALARLEADWRRDGDDTRFAAALSEHLRRLSRLVRADAPALSGSAWIAFLDRHGDGFADVRDALVDAPYRPAARIDAARLYALVDRHTRRVLATELADV